ncbi:MAG: alanine--tRNA ligase [Nitrosopumilus sp.]|nr:alanine--tRNA ligase [Nitrosopumilus sp.]MBT3573915.1 alanine--tRNA ligase [Nitrosopumilus sp.]MBT3862042.1 alanine--tRNA ligase [Nitrosopumilus sp.]MBT4299217.1 alanine--tRNA ligase [Nitrosopumilus sp.]MBT6083415.1 alanine--tRNA ligase [Nitrosopumilus sp.]
MDKNQILKEFSADPDRYYKVKLFEEQGFIRKACTKCGRFFWTLDANRTLCPDDGTDTYSFIGDPPTTKRFDYTQSWKQVEEFFVKNNHTSVSRYPVVCRWRDDLYFTIASVVDFQRVMGSKVVFEFPANPLVVPQTCLRFNDLENVGVTGRHFSSFCMIGQHSIPENGGYWKDECVDLDFRLLTQQFGIKKEEVVFVEDVWSGGGSFGSSLEYFVRGLELGNAVFTEFQGELGQHTTLDQKIIDMGAGLERFAWITNGTPTAYDCCFGPVNQILFEKIGIDSDSEMLKKYFTEIAREIDHFDDLNQVRRLAVKSAGITEDQVNKIITPLEGMYLIADHLRTLIFAIADGALPSNVGGGYNLRMMLRRINGTINQLNLKLDIDELIDAHIDYLKDTYPELDEKREDVKTILKLESSRYEESKIHMKKKAEKIREKGAPSVDELITLYESDGITPEYLKEIDAISEIPSQFYSKLSDLHQSEKKKAITELPLEELPETETLFYKDDPMEFEAKVIKVLGDQVVLDRTSFYARGGGQEPDLGTISEFNVVNVDKHANIIVHKLEGGVPKEGDTVSCKVDETRRANITKNHTSTHIINVSSRGVLGSWIWQHSAFKDDDHARLDITHHSSLTDEQVKQIEDAANQMVKENYPVNIDYYDRGTAEQKYGFKIYQGGVVPVKSVRIVSIEDKDIEACGGTHVKKTGDIELIKITKTKRIQDGVVRIEFVSGPTAFQYVKDQEEESKKQAANDTAKEKLEKLREENKEKSREQIPILLEKILAGQSGELDEITIKNKICFTSSENYDDYFCQTFGKKIVAKDGTAAFCGIFEAGPTIRVIIFAGEQSGVNAGEIVKEIASILGGSGGGDAKFAQGGGKDTSKKDAAIQKAKSMILG